MGIVAIGDRVHMMDMVELLKKKKMHQDTTASLWSGITPLGMYTYLCILYNLSVYCFMINCKTFHVLRKELFETGSNTIQYISFIM